MYLSYQGSEGCAPMHRPGSNPKTTPLFMSVEFFFGFVGFSSCIPVSPSPNKPTLPNSNSI